MTPKEKAKELVDNFIDKMFYLRDGYNAMEVFATAKQCALIAVDEIIKVCPYIDLKVRETEDQLSAFDFQFVSYWKEVKQEIEKL
jgi:hypothetical protein